MTDLRFDWSASRARTLQERYDDWRATPDGQATYDNVRERAFRLLDRGWHHFGIGALWEAARYDRALLVGPDATGLKLNNDYRSRIVRELMEREPRLADFFETRALKA
jgi:hypothetical protein